MTALDCVRSLGPIDPLWLRQRYEDDKWTQAQIAQACGKAQDTIGRHLVKYGIQLRSRSYAVFLGKGNQGPKLSAVAVEFIEGELLGDGSIRSRCQWSGCYAHGSQYSAYLAWLSKTLADFGIEQSGSICVQDTRWGRGYRYLSLNYEALGPLHHRWYPAGVKIVPANLVLTSLMARQWYIGDGSLRKKRQGQSQEIVLCTDGFSFADGQFLRDSLAGLGFNTSIQTVRGHQPRLRINPRSVPDFLNWIGPCPEPIQDIYGYKWEVG